MVEVIEVKVLPPDKWLEPCLLIECEVEAPPNQCLIEIKGLLLTEDGKIISRLEEIPGFLQGDNEIGELIASNNAEWQRRISSNAMQRAKFHFTAPLSQYAIDHIERLREKRLPKRDIELKVRFSLKYLVSNVSVSHLFEVDSSVLPPQLKSEFEKIRVVEGRHPDSLIVYQHYPEFSSRRANMWILSGYSGAKFLSFGRGEREFTLSISYDRWVYDFLPRLKAYTIATIEVPISEPLLPTHEHLAKAVKELEHVEKSLREGNLDAVIRSIRNIVLNHLLTEIKEVDDQGNKESRRFLDEGIKKIILANVPSEAKKEYEMVLDGVEGILRRLLHNHLSKFIHLDTGKLLRMPLKEDAEYLFLTITGIVRYLSKMSLPSSK
jgi:hypothetical protein